MKAKIINMLLCRKFDHFLASITDGSVRKLVEKHTVITGGCITSLLLNEEVSDFDVYFRNKETAVAVAKYYVDTFKSNPPTTFAALLANKQVDIRVDSELSDRVRVIVQSAGIAGEEGSSGYKYFEQDSTEAGEQSAEEYVREAIGINEELDDMDAKKLDGKQEEKDDKAKAGRKYRPVYLSSNAITLSDKIQVVVRFFGEPDEIHGNYDFLHCMNYWTSWDRTVVLRKEALESILTKELRYVGSKYPICSVIRTRKFLVRGWRINAGQYLKMAWQISKLDLSNLQVLEEQMIGVDAAYFHDLIERLRAEDPNKVDGSYLMSIIDKVF